MASSSSHHALQSPPREEEEIRPPPQLSRRLEEILSMGRAATLLMPSYEFWESDGTISDDDDDDPANFPAGGAVALASRRVYSGHVCGKGFGSPKAVGGHMRVHDPRGPHGYVAITGGWVATGKRGCTGGGSNKGKAAVSSSDELNHSSSIATTTVVSAAGPKRPLPLAFARSNLSSSLSMASARTTTNLESGETSSPHSVHDNPMAPAAAGGAEQGQQQVIIQLAPAAPPPAPRQKYTCKLCGKSYPTHQGLGGHAAGHRNRRKEAEAAAAGGGVVPAAARQDKEKHDCKKCGRVFATGVALGGHMRMHYQGPPIVHRRSSSNKKQCVEPQPTVGMEDLTLTLGIKAGQPSSSPATGCRLRLFGIDVGPPAAEAPPAVQEVPHGEAAQGEGSSSGMTTEGSDSAGGQRQEETVERSSTDSPSKESSN